MRNYRVISKQNNLGSWAIGKTQADSFLKNKTIRHKIDFIDFKSSIYREKYMIPVDNVVNTHTMSYEFNETVVRNKIVFNIKNVSITHELEHGFTSLINLEKQTEEMLENV